LKRKGFVSKSKGKPIEQQYRRTVSPKTDNHKRYIQSILDNQVTFCIGPAGTGKTSMAVGTALTLLEKGDFERLVITRPVVESGENLGYLPGSADEKIGPYMLPVMDEALFYLGSYSALQALKNKTNKQNGQPSIEVIPLAYMRGLSFHKTLVILDEAQNVTYRQLKMFLSRIGVNSKIIINGDTTQCDLPRHKRGGLQACIDAVSNIRSIGTIHMDRGDVVRSGIVAEILDRLEQWEQHYPQINN